MHLESLIKNYMRCCNTLTDTSLYKCSTDIFFGKYKHKNKLDAVFNKEIFIKPEMNIDVSLKGIIRAN